MSSREISCVIWSSDSTRSSCGGSCGCPLFSKPAWAGGVRWLTMGGLQDVAWRWGSIPQWQRLAATARGSSPAQRVEWAGGPHLANCKKALDDVLAALVDGALMQDRAEALKHGVQAAGGDILRSGQWEGGRSARWAGCSCGCSPQLQKGASAQPSVSARDSVPARPTAHAPAGMRPRPCRSPPPPPRCRHWGSPASAPAAPAPAPHGRHPVGRRAGEGRGGGLGAAQRCTQDLSKPPHALVRRARMDASVPARA